MIENKQSLTPTLHRDCGINNSSLGFMTNSSGLRAPLLQSQDLNQMLFQLFSDSFMCAIMYDSLVFTHNTLLPVLAGPCLTLVITSCQSIPVVHECWPRSHRPVEKTPLLFNRGRTRQDDKYQWWPEQSLENSKLFRKTYACKVLIWTWMTLSVLQMSFDSSR